jgi:multiple sugar transport system ATP-binding protein
MDNVPLCHYTPVHVWANVSMPEIVLENVGKTYPNGVSALEGLDLHVADSELLVLVGPSGCGKTTTLRLIAGLEEPTSGNVRIGDRAVTHLPPAERNVGFVFQRPALYPHRKVRDNLGFGLAIRQRDSWFRRLFSATSRAQAHTRAERVMATAHRLGLQDVLDRYPTQLSGGQQQRVALGRALVRQPEVLLLDEPLSNLDAGLRQELRRELHLLQKQLQATMVYVTHDPVEALSLGDRVAVLHQGQLQQVDAPERLYEDPANRFVAGFIGWPAMNLVDGELQHDSDGSVRFAGCLGRWPVPADVAARWAPWVGRPLTLGIRPHDVHLEEPQSTSGWPMQVRLVESLGRDRLVTLAGGQGELSALLTGGCQTAGALDRMVAGKNVMVHLQLHQGYLFDRVSGQALKARPAG